MESSFKAIERAISDISKVLPDGYKVDTKRFAHMKKTCGLFDQVCSEYGCTERSIRVLDGSYNIGLMADVSDMTVNESYHILYELIGRSVQCGFFYSDVDNMVFTIVVPSIWVQEE